MLNMKFAALAAVAVLSTALPTQAATWLAATSDADFAAQNATNTFTTYGSAVIQWGRAGTTNWEAAVKDGSGKVLQSSQVNWGPISNILNPTGSTPLLAYTSAGKTTLAFTTNGVKVTDTGTATKGADTLWIRGVTPLNAYSTSVILVGLQIKYTGGVWIDIDFLNADSDAEYVGFSDPKLALGFTLRYGFGYLNNGTYNGIDDTPSFNFILGKYATPLEDNIAPWDRAGPTSVSGFGRSYDDFGADSSARMMAETFSLSAVPEPAGWAMLIAGFGMVGGTMRRRRPIAA